MSDPPAYGPNDLLDKHEAAAYLGMSVHTFRVHCYHPQRGTMPPADTTKGGANCWRRRTLDKWRAGHPAPITEETHI